jgi:hypothetical protein
MENKINTEIRRFSQSIVNIINQSQLPAELKRLSLYMIYSEVDKMANAAIEREQNTTYTEETVSLAPTETETPQGE